MSDPRNVAHNKKVKQEKAHHHDSGDKVKKSRASKSTANTSIDANPPADAATPPVAAPGDLEKSQAVLSKLKEMEFHSRANIETLAELQLTIEEELKQKEFSDPLGQVYSAQDNFHTRIAELIQSYETKLGTMLPSA
jgi:hypothetical protein